MIDYGVWSTVSARICAGILPDGAAVCNARSAGAAAAKLSANAAACAYHLGAGRRGREAYMVAAGNSVLLMDSENSVFYIKSTDASGMPQPLRVFDYTERGKQAPQKPETVDDKFVTREEFDALRARFDALTADKPGKGDNNAKSTV